MTAYPHLPVRLSPLALFGALLVVVVAIEHTVVGRADFSQHPALPIGVACDLLLVLPALFYICVVRQYKLPFSTMAAAFGGGLALSHWLMPAAGLTIVSWASRLGAALELLVIGYAAMRVRRIWRGYQAARQHSADFIENMHVASQPVLGRLTGVLVSEISLFRYALLGSWAQPEVLANEQAFSSYRRSGFIALLATVGGLGLIEAAAAHLMLGHWFPRGAWLLTIPSGYSLLLLLAHGQAVRLRPVTVSAQQLVVRTGLMWRVAIPMTQVVAADQISEAPPAAPDCLNTASQLLAPPNLLLTLAEPQLVRGPYGLRRTVRRLAIYVDEPVTLQRALQRPSVIGKNCG